MGIARVMSAFEDLMVRVDAEHDRASFLMPPSEQHKTAASNTDDQTETKLKHFCGRLGWDTKPVLAFLPLLEYFSVARNCIVHRSGRASPVLVMLAQSSELMRSHTDFPTRTGTKLPKLPSVSIDRETQWLPRHAVLASAVCYELAKYLNTRLAQAIGHRGMVYMAAYHSLLAEERIPTGARRSTEVVVRHVLVDRYRAKDVSLAEVIATLRDIDKWRVCLKGFQRLVSSAL
jgi:hypothetical protein